MKINQLTKAIARVELQVQIEQVKLARHKHYFRNFINENRVVLSGLYLIGFLIAWRVGKKRNMLGSAMQIAKLASLNVARNLGKRLLLG